MLQKIVEIIAVKPFEITCKFNTGEVRTIELKEWVREFKEANNGWTSKLAEPEYFKTVKLASYSTLAWDNEVDFDPEVLYNVSEPSVEYRTTQNPATE